MTPGTFRGMVILLLLLSGCYTVAFREPNLYTYQTEVPLKAAFYMDEDLKEKSYSSRAWSSGILNRWDVPVGNVIHLYAQSYLKKGFNQLDEINDPTIKSNYDVVIKLVDIHYYLADQAAHSDITFTIENSQGHELLNKKYHADGPSGFGRVIMAGPFAQKSAIRQSTHVVLENIFTHLMDDIQSEYTQWKIP